MASNEARSQVPLQITEEEAALYDRQIRLWGLEAQQRMRTARILVVGLRGVATEVIKNLVLAGIGSLVMADNQDVKEEDLGSGFFYRDEDVGKKRVYAAKARVEALNPLVTVEAVPLSQTPEVEVEQLSKMIQGVDLVCITDHPRDSLIRINDACRRLERLFYAGGTYGLLGYIFCDLLEHDYIASDRSSAKDGPKNIKMTQSYVPLQKALTHRWASLTRRQTKELNPSVVFSILGVWEFQARRSALPDSIQDSSELASIVGSQVSAAGVNKQVLSSVSLELMETVSTTAAHEFSPVCAVVGGLLAQDMLKALSKREPPIANFLSFDGNTGSATVCRMMME